MMFETKISFPRINQDRCIAEKDHHIYRTTARRFLIDQKFARERAKSIHGIKSEHIVWRNRYPRTLVENKYLPPEQCLAKIYTDESHIYHHYSRDEYSIYGPTDHEYAEVKRQKKGRRCCICAAIERYLQENRFKLLPKSGWILFSNGKGSNRDDYDKNVNGMNCMR